MFVVGAAAPTASGRRAVLPVATQEAVVLGWEVIRARCKADGKELSRSFGNFDQRVGLGWLLGDLVLGELIAFDDALAVGTKAVKQGPDFKAAFAAPSRRAGKARYSSDEDRERALAAAAAEERTLRRTDPELPFPAASPRPLVPKRKRTEADPPEPPDHLACLRADAAKAETALALAEGKLAAAKRAAQQAREKYDCARDRAHTANTARDFREEHAEAMAAQQRECGARMCELERAIGPVEQDWLRARFEANEARIDVQEEEKERERRAQREREEQEEAAACAALSGSMQDMHDRYLGLAERHMATLKKMGRTLASLAEKERMFGDDCEMWDDMYAY